MLQKPDLSFRQSLILMVLLLVGALFIYIHNIARLPPGVVPDNLYYLTDGMRISHGLAYPLVLGFRASLIGRGDDPEPFFRYLVGGWFVLVGPAVFTGQFLQVILNLTSTALTYRVGLALLRDRAWRRLGSVAAAGVIGSSSMFVFLSRTPGRPVLVPPLLLCTFLILLIASRSRRGCYWSLAGFLASCGVHTYTAGLVTPVWAAGFVLHQAIIAPRRQRISLRNAALAFIGALPPLIPLGVLIALIPDLYFRARDLSNGNASLFRDLQGLFSSFELYFLRGHHLWEFNYNTPDAPMLPPVIALLALVGIGLAFWSWRKAEGALLLGGLIAFSLPSALSPDKTAFRAIGALPILALLSGWAVCWLLNIVPSTLQRFNRVVVLSHIGTRLWQRRLPQVIVSAAILVAMIGSDLTYQRMFSNPTPDLDFENLFYTNFYGAIAWLTQVTQPTYVPAWVIDNPAATFYLELHAFPTVTTWARYGLTTLPQGQYFFPTHWYHLPTTQDKSVVRALLLPAAKTIVILPVVGLPAPLDGPAPFANDPAAVAVQDAQGRVVGYREPVSAAPLQEIPTLMSGEKAPTVGSGMRLLVRRPTPDVQPGKRVNVVLEWLVTAPQPADDFSTLQVIEPNFFAAYGASDHVILPFLYPSAMWKPGDIIPDEASVEVPANLNDGVYRWGVGIYVPPNPARFAVTPPDNFSFPQLPNLWLWNASRLSSQDPPEEQLPANLISLNAHLGDDIALEGYTLSLSGSTATLNLFWRTNRKPAGDYTIFIHAEQDGKLVLQHDESTVTAAFPTSTWKPGQLVKTSYTLSLPESGTSPITLYTGMYDYPSFERLPVIQGGKAPSDRRVNLGSLEGV